MLLHMWHGHARRAEEEARLAAQRSEEQRRQAEKRRQLQEMEMEARESAAEDGIIAPIAHRFFLVFYHSKLIFSMLYILC